MYVLTESVITKFYCTFHKVRLFMENIHNVSDIQYACMYRSVSPSTKMAKVKPPLQYAVQNFTQRLQEVRFSLISSVFIAKTTGGSYPNLQPGTWFLLQITTQHNKVLNCRSRDDVCYNISRFFTTCNSKLTSSVFQLLLRKAISAEKMTTTLN